MSQDITARVLQLFNIRLKNAPEISSATVEELLNEQSGNDFGDDEDLINAIVDAMEEKE